MKYNLLTKNYNDFNTFEINKLAARSYFIPHTSATGIEASSFLTERRVSDKILLLNGDWDMKYFATCKKLPNEFDSATEIFEKVVVPSTWQRTGFELPNYLNSRYQFKLNPPNIPANTPCAVYRKTITMEISDKNFLLNFLGVASCFDLFVNGDYVGYSEGSHNTAEFDITNHLTDGENEIIAVVYKWCNGSYLECQDMFRENGIFRDVYIIKEDKFYLSDFGYSTEHNIDGTYNFTFEYSLNNACKDIRIEYQLLGSNGEIISDHTFNNTTCDHTHTNLNVLEWSAECPNLYKLITCTYYNNELISTARKMVGFKHIEITGNVLYLNGKKIKLKGVNHHESHPVNGYVMSAEELEKDVILLKEYNANCVRLSHYPHDPIFLTLCDIHGLYSIDEADIECHGIYSNPLNARFGLISNNPEWKDQFLDRVKRMFMRDRFHVSIVMWSLGNEAGGDACHDEAYRYLKSVTPIPVHYEGVWHTKRFSYDLVCQFYPSFKQLQSYVDGTADKKYTEKPYFMSEFAHAMGVGPGGLATYYDYILANDNFLGGCIWEFCDHIVYNPENKYNYTYGGDYKEKKHDGNFCVDGLFFPDRTPSTGALNMREVYRPIRSTKTGGEFTFTNTNYFADTSDITITWTMIRNGKPMNSRELDVIIPAGSSTTLVIPAPMPRDMSEYCMSFTYTDKKGVYIAREDHMLTPPLKHIPSTAPPEYTISRNNINITTDKGIITFNKKSGELSSYFIDGKEMINQSPQLKSRGMLPNIYRKPIDNDRFIKIGWSLLGTLKATPKHKRTTISSGDCLILTSKYSIRGYGKLASCTMIRTITNKGHILVDIILKKALKLAFYSDIARFGITLELNSNLDNISYYGLGDRETLPDFDEHGKIGIYDMKVTDMHERYIMPQESGNRSKVRWAKITDSDGTGIGASMLEDFFNVNANHYTRKQLTPCKHLEDLKEVDTTCLQVDGFMRGAGSQSCGPQPLPEFRPNLKTPLNFKFIIFPISVNESDNQQ